MRTLLILAVSCFTVAITMPREERFIHLPSMKTVVSHLESVLHSGATKEACSVACHAAFSVVGFLCGPACSEVLKLIG
ncbi:hypothetical protein SNE40_007167 [Patella caerulea]|uniref:Uncharacterized protein n=1 Tax=Patella caerulea TaxID=87958 RepID=A0AAN8PUK8_PATCE